MAFFNEAWFIHAVNDAVVHLAQQKEDRVMGTVRVRSGVVGKTDPWQRLGTVEMVPVVARDADTTYLNPPQTKRRTILRDDAAAVLIDEFDTVKTLTNPQSEFTQMLAYARARRMDRHILSVPPTGVGGAIGLATTVDEAAESTGTQAMLAGNIIANGGTNLTMAKLRQAAAILNAGEVEQDDRTFFYSPAAMRALLADTQVTSSDYSSIHALSMGTFPMDATWMGFRWRMSNLLPITGNIRSLIGYQKMAVGLSIGLFKNVEANTAPHKWNNVQVVLKLSAGAVRIDDAGVVQIDVDESVGL
jgi:capsid protein